MCTHIQYVYVHLYQKLSNCGDCGYAPTDYAYNHLTQGLEPWRQKVSPWLWALTGSECGNEFQGHFKTNPASQKYLGFQGVQHCPAFNNGEMHKILGSRLA